MMSEKQWTNLFTLDITKASYLERRSDAFSTVITYHKNKKIFSTKIRDIV